MSSETNRNPQIDLNAQLINERCDCFVVVIILLLLLLLLLFYSFFMLLLLLLLR